MLELMVLPVQVQQVAPAAQILEVAPVEVHIAAVSVLLVVQVSS